MIFVAFSQSPLPLNDRIRVQNKVIIFYISCRIIYDVKVVFDCPE